MYLQNVIYQEAAGICKLCDFGLSRLMPPGVSKLDPEHLGTGGTPAYQGPEVLKRHPIGFRVDLYGFGIMIWEMFTSTLPWSDCDLEQMTRRVAVANERPPVPRDMPAEYATVMQHCWASDPSNRPDFATLLPVIQQLKAAHPVPASPYMMSASAPQQPRRAPPASGPVRYLSCRSGWRACSPYILPSSRMSCLN